MATRIIPGVSVQVLREIVPPLPAASGVLGVIGVTQDTPERLTPISSFPSFLEVFGPASSFSMPEIRQAFENGIAEVIVAPVGGGSAGTLNLIDSSDDTVATLTARASGPWSAGVSVTVTPKGSPASVIDVTLAFGDVQETFRNLTGATVATTLDASSALVSGRPALPPNCLWPASPTSAPATIPRRAITPQRSNS